MTEALLAMLVPEAISAVKAGVQAVQAQQLKNQYKRPNYEIPEAYREQLNVLAQNANNPNMPGFEGIVSQMKDNLGDSLYRATEYGDPTKAVFSAGLGAETLNDVLAKIGVNGAQMMAKNKSAYAAGLANYGQLQDNAFKINQLDPYEAAKAAESALREASFKNTENALKGVTGAYLTDRFVFNPEEYTNTGASKSGGAKPWGKPTTIPGFEGPTGSQSMPPKFEWDETMSIDYFK